MQTFRDDDRQLERYVLGLLTEEETERLDEASIADDELAARLRMVEDDLVDGYVRGTLDRETRDRFDAYYLASPRRRNYVKFATNFVRAVDRAAARPDAANGTSSAIVRSKFVWMLAAAAALFAAVVGPLAFETIRLRRQLIVAQRQNTALDGRARDLAQQVNDQRAATDAAVKQVKQLAEARAGAARAQSTAQVAAPDNAVLQPPAVALVLLPQTRAVAPIPTLTVPPHADRVPVELRLESNDFPEYRIGLKDPATNQIVWRSGWIRAKSSGDQPSIAVAVPARVLKTQHYSLDLTGRGAAGPEVVGSYAFRVAPP